MEFRIRIVNRAAFRPGYMPMRKAVCASKNRIRACVRIAWFGRRGIMNWKKEKNSAGEAASGTRGRRLSSGTADGSRKNAKREYYVRYTLLFLLAALIVYIRFIVNGKSFLWASDGTDQHFTALAWFGQYLREYLTGIVARGDFTLPQWSFSLGAGDDILTTLHYYCIGDPLDLLAVFFRPENTEGLYTFLILLRLYLSGIAFSEFVFYMRRKKNVPSRDSDCGSPYGWETSYSVLVGALVYCFCGFVIAGTMKHAFFFNPLLYFPLFCLGAEKILRKESPRLFILITAVAALSNFYFFYMLTVLTLIYCAVRFFGLYGKGKRARGFRSVFPKGVASYMLGVGMGAVLFLPVVLRFLNNPRYVDDAAKLKSFYSLKYMGRMVSSFSGPPLSSGYWNFLGYASIAFLCVILLFATHWKKHLQLKVFFVLGVLMLSVPAAGYALNGFAYMSNRWMFAFSMLVGYLCAELLPELVYASKKRFLWLVAGAGALLALNLFSALMGYRTEFYGLAGILLLIGFAALYRREVLPMKKLPAGSKEKIFRTGVIGLTILSVGVNANYHYKGMVKQFADAGTYYESVMESPLVEMAETAKGLEGEEDTFYRVDGYVLDNRRTADSIVEERSMEAMMAVFTGSTEVLEAQENDDTLGDTADEWEDTSLKEWEATSETNSGEEASEDESSQGENSSLFYRLAKALGLTITGKEKAIRSYNTALLADYNGLMAYYSLMNPYYSRFIVNEDISTANFSIKVASFDGRMALNAIAGVKYLIRSDIYQDPIPYGCKEIASVTGEDGITATLYENEYALPLGFTYDTYIMNDEVDVSSGLRRQQLMLSSVILEEEPENGKAGSTNAGLKKAELTPRSDTQVILGKKKMEFVNRKDWVIYDTDVPEGCEVYLYIENARFKGGSGYSVAAAAADGTLRQCTLYSKSKKDYFGRKDILMNLGYYEEGLNELAFTMSEVGTLRYDTMILYYVPVEKTVQKIEERAAEPLTDIEITANRITGRIEADADKLLFLSVPYSEGFTATVNGEPAKIYLANGTFMAIEIPEGVSEIALNYSTPGLRYGAMISAVSVSIYLLWEIAGLVRSRKRKR